jgi:hypothetical protein
MFCFCFLPKKIFKKKKNFSSTNSTNLASFWGRNCQFLIKKLTKKTLVNALLISIIVKKGKMLNTYQTCFEAKEDIKSCLQ